MRAGRWVRVGLVAVFGLHTAVALAAGHIVEITWSEKGRFAHRGEVAPGKFVEVCGAVPVNTQVHWRFQANAPLDFNIHYHEGKQVQTPVQLDGVRRGFATLHVRAAQDHCWMWRNRGDAPVSFSLTLRR